MAPPLMLIFTTNACQELNKMLLPADSLQDQSPSRYTLIPLPVAVLLTTVVIMCLLVTTIVFILFIRYRRYSENKATSPYLSLLMFVGSYFIFYFNIYASNFDSNWEPNRHCSFSSTVWKCDLRKCYGSQSHFFNFSSSSAQSVSHL